MGEGLRLAAPRPVALAAALAFACGDDPCPTGSSRGASGLCVLDEPDSGGPIRYSNCALDTGSFEDPVAVDASLTWARWGDGFFRTYCTSCHSAAAENRRGAPESVDFDSEAAVLGWGERIRVRVIEEATMPLGGGVTDGDLLLLDRYLCRLGVE